MSISISQLEDNKRIAFLQLGSDIWDLPSLFKVFEQWLASLDSNWQSDIRWIADIGFSPRDGACGGGPIISRQIMQICIDRNIEIYLSEYNDSD